MGLSAAVRVQSCDIRQSRNQKLDQYHPDSSVAVFEAAFLFRLAPEDFVVAVRVERRVDVDQIDAVIGQLPQLLEIVAAVDDAGVDQRGGFSGH